MQAFTITDKGLERIALLELDELIKVKGKEVKAEDCAVIFNCKSFQDLFKFCYFAQSIERVLLLFANFEFKESKDLLSKFEKEINKIKFKEWFDKNTTFKVECKRMGRHRFGSSTVEQDLGEKIILRVKKELGFAPKAKMESPDTIFYVFINNNKAYLGVDLIGRDLSKRQYKIFSAPGIVNANLSYAISRIAGFDGKKKLVDVICKSGLVCIEAALYASKLSVNYYSKDFAFKKLKPYKKNNWDGFFKKLDSKADTKTKLNILGLDSMLRNVEASKKNSKLAGVDKIIGFSKMDVEWLDTKLDKASVDIIASRIPCPSKHTSKSFITKLYKELFYQAEFVMKKQGLMVLLTENTSLLKQMITKAFKLIKEYELWAGKQRYEVVVVEKV
ncbi:hypothetical protein KY348_00385 [Candidatus Woesearchaeota archaeon]|nr:hypothetical protein [Candidatus Woesearchaeota archaeon]